MSGARKPYAFVFDVDGTLVRFTEGLRRHLEPDAFDLDAYHRATVSEAPVAKSVVVLLQALQAADVAIVISTYRERLYREDTMRLFDRLNIWPKRTYMRLAEDRELTNVAVKAKHLDRIAESYEIIGMADDDPAIEALCQERGIPILVVPGWLAEADTTNRHASD